MSLGFPTNYHHELTQIFIRTKLYQPPSYYALPFVKIRG